MEQDPERIETKELEPIVYDFRIRLIFGRRYKSTAPPGVRDLFTLHIDFPDTTSEEGRTREVPWDQLSKEAQDEIARHKPGRFRELIWNFSMGKPDQAESVYRFIINEFEKRLRGFLKTFERTMVRATQLSQYFSEERKKEIEMETRADLRRLGSVQEESGRPSKYPIPPPKKLAKQMEQVFAELYRRRPKKDPRLIEAVRLLIEKNPEYVNHQSEVNISSLSERIRTTLLDGGFDWEKLRDVAARSVESESPRN